MARAIRISGRRLIKVLEAEGYALRRIRGSHHILKPHDGASSVVVPLHGSEALPLGTLRAILRQLGWTADDLRKRVQN